VASMINILMLCCSAPKIYCPTITTFFFFSFQKELQSPIKARVGEPQELEV
jgi:hypothetical protein